MIHRAERLADLLRRGQELTSPDPLAIVPTPPLDELTKTGSASVDLRLGAWFLSLRQGRMAVLDIEEHEEPRQLTKSHYVPFGSYYVLHPGSFVLGATLEWIRVPKGMAAYVIGRSSWGRRGLIIATATGVHPAFVGCLTLELSNVGEVPIKIPPGVQICQLFFHDVGDAASKWVDQSKFVGFRKPTLGKLALDDVAKALRRGFNPDS